VLEGFAVDLLAHEAFEQLLLHPLLAARLPSGPEVATERVREEGRLDQLLRRMLTATLGDTTSDIGLTEFHQHLIEHTEREEIEVFPYLRHVIDRDQLDRLGALYTAVHRCASAQPSSIRDVWFGNEATPRGPLLRIRDFVATALTDLGTELPSDVGTGTDPLEAPLRPPPSRP
jgi:hypothetical protein